MKWFTAAMAAIPLTTADALVLAGFSVLSYGLWVTFGVGPTCIAVGSAVLWTGVVMFKMQAGRG